MLKGLRTAVIYAADLESAKTWYASFLGIEPYFDEPFYVGFNVGGFELGIDPDCECVKMSNRAQAYWGVDDIQLAFNRLIEQGAASIQTPTEVGGGIKVAQVRDPFDNLLGIIENPHFSL